MTTMKAEHPDDNDVYCTLARGLVSHNDHRREIACETLDDGDTDEPLIIEFAANSKVMPDNEGKGAYITCVLWVPNPNYEEDNDE